MLLPSRPRNLLLVLATTTAITTAEVLGPVFPAPTDLTSSTSLVKAAWTTLSATLDAYLNGGVNTTSTLTLTGADNVTWSTGLFSLHDAAAAADLQYHWTSSEVATANYGTRQVGGDSIYRIASVSKLITAFVGQLELTVELWNTPISELIPDLGDGGDGENPLDAPQWTKITPWALVNQQSGVTTNGLPVADLIGKAYAPIALATNTSITELETSDGLPPVELSALGPCTDITDPICQVRAFLPSVRDLHANFQPWTTPAYSNFGFMLLGLAISNATGKSYDELYLGSVFEPLRMSSSFVNPPSGGADFDRSVIVGATPEAGGFNIPGSQITFPSGGLLSTTNDLAKLGIGILNSTLLAPEKTREWMKPHSHSASLTYSVGAPWEIVRYVHPDSGRVTDIYTKLGDSGFYGGILALIPDYNAGFSFLDAASNAQRSSVALNIISVIAETIVPALEAQAQAEAKKNFVGEYHCQDGALNSSLTIAFNETTIPGPSAPALSISRWISNGTDMTPFFGNIQPQLQLTVPKQVEGPGPVAFEAYVSPQWNAYANAGLGPFSGFYASNFGWAQVDMQRYGGFNLGSFDFDIDGEGKATAVRTAGTRATLAREED